MFKIQPDDYDVTEYEYSIQIEFLDFKPEPSGASYYYAANHFSINGHPVNLQMFDSGTKE